MIRHALALLGTASLLGACADSNDAAEDKIEREAEASAATAGMTVAALGLTEAQLLEADLRGPGGIELGDVTQVVRDKDGNVERLLIEVEDSNPDRYVHVPISGLSTIATGAKTDLSTTMTLAQIKALPEVKLPVP